MTRRDRRTASALAALGAVALALAMLALLRGAAPDARDAATAHPTAAPSPTVPSGPTYLRQTFRLLPPAGDARIGREEAIRIARTRLADPEHGGEIHASRWGAIIPNRGKRPVPVWVVGFDGVPAIEAATSEEEAAVPIGARERIAARHIVLVGSDTGEVVGSHLQSPGPIFTADPGCPTCGWSNLEDVAPYDSCPRNVPDPGVGKSGAYGEWLAGPPDVVDAASSADVAVLVEVVGKRRSRWNTTDGCPPRNWSSIEPMIVTPLEARVERVLLDRVGAGTGAELVLDGGRIGMSLLGNELHGGALQPGRWILIAAPLRTVPYEDVPGGIIPTVPAAPTPDPRVTPTAPNRRVSNSLLVHTAYRIDDANRVIRMPWDLRPGLLPFRLGTLPLAETVRRIEASPDQRATSGNP